MDDILLEYLIADGVLTDIVDAGVSVDNGIGLDDALDLVHWNSAALDAHIAQTEAEIDSYSQIWVM